MIVHVAVPCRPNIAKEPVGDSSVLSEFSTVVADTQKYIVSDEQQVTLCSTVHSKNEIELV